MFSRLAFTLAKPAARPAVPGRLALQARFLSQNAPGSQGRKTGFKGVRATAPAASSPATLTIRVRRPYREAHCRR